MDQEDELKKLEGIGESWGLKYLCFWFWTFRVSGHIFMLFESYKYKHIDIPANIQVKVVIKKNIEIESTV